MFKKPNYISIAKESVITVELTAEEVAVIYEAYDFGIEALDAEAMQTLNKVINTLKYELWP